MGVGLGAGRGGAAGRGAKPAHFGYGCRPRLPATEFAMPNPNALPEATAATRAVRVWDLPTRVFHWLLASMVVALIVTGYVGALDWHMRIGLMVLALLVFRLVWGLVGGRWSRFASFIYAPATLLRYLRGQQRPGEHFEVGHNPLGSLSVLGMLALLLLQVATGLVADDEVATTGPLNKYVANARALAATAWHTGAGQWILIAMVVLHLAAILFYKRRGISLVKPMLVGDKLLAGEVPPSRDTWATRLLALVLALLCMTGAGLLAKLGG